MKHFTNRDLEGMERIYRGNLINSVTGYKSANLLATRSKNGVDNVAIFSSVTHLGSNPAMFSFIQRPLGHGAGDTYKNLKETGQITLNHINTDILEAAHQSSAKYDPTISEFEHLDIEKEMRDGIEAPFVKAAKIQVSARYESEYYLKENKCILVICRITDIFLKEGIQAKDGWIHLEKAGSMAINGLDGYSTANLEKRLSYAKVGKELTDLEFEI
ncbi:NADH-FMN oxidoreductase RutF, flavin reductase (DIM6/NTAB) family [Nonlabens sp. Hel1_33_55]|uniref:flavin reductase family protein n=1 Tax=Nonlabens sp. Hel1_33_55 TaxID=1336802 RepID=UPI000875BB95|nr:flavin reductase [Nonlabens sp. Hel1_33_55]SCX91450.1 NADH-FMN oxidoreductase RutF, flavin reductase (DIM6/NTAB) family [Nonlabens sp. Hel1_33_55]